MADGLPPPQNNQPIVPAAAAPVQPAPLSPANDVTSPYFVHPSEGTNMALINFVFTGDNFDVWNKQVIRSLSAKSKLGFITGTLPRPDDDDVLAPLWDRCNNTILCWILNCVSPSLAESLSYCDTASKLWTTMNQRFTQNNTAEKFRVKREILMLVQGNKSVTEFHTRLTRLWDELSALKGTQCVCGVAAQDAIEDQVFQFLFGLNDCFQNIRSTILATDPVPELSIVYSKVKYEEIQQALKNSSLQDNSALLTATGGLTHAGAPSNPLGLAVSHHNNSGPIIGSPIGPQFNVTNGPLYGHQALSTNSGLGFGQATNSNSNGPSWQVTNSNSRAPSWQAQRTSPNNRGPAATRRTPGRGNRGSDLRCTSCDGTGHTHDTCFVVHGYPSWYTGRRITMEDVKRRRAENSGSSLHVHGTLPDTYNTDVPPEAFFAGRYHGDADWSG